MVVCIDYRGHAQREHPADDYLYEVRDPQQRESEETAAEYLGDDEQKYYGKYSRRKYRQNIAELIKYIFHIAFPPQKNSPGMKVTSCGI